MAKSISLEIPDSIIQQAEHLASHTKQRPEDILLEWLTVSFTDHPIETLPDSQILAFCQMQLDDQQQITLSNLLSKQRENDLTSSEGQELQFLLRIYRKGLVRKAKAIKIAVECGLMEPLDAT